MLNVYDRSLVKTAVLENRFDPSEEIKINAVSMYTFSMPADDIKLSKCKPYHFVREGETGRLYRILNPLKAQGDIGIKTFPCEHVIATLSDDVMFQEHTVGGFGYSTSMVIEYILAQQVTRRWKLGECDFSRNFEYHFSSENLLTALFSIPAEFTDPYMWAFDTSTYPWTVSLKRIDAGRSPQFYVRSGKNLLSFETQGNEDTVCTRIFGLGCGEGVNQLTIASVNGGVPYLQAPQQYIDKYGLVQRILVDRRFEIAENLKARMQAILNELQDPPQTTTVKAADLHNMTGEDYDRAEIGRTIYFEDEELKTYITGMRRRGDIPGDLELTLSTKPTDVASTIADMANRQRIEAIYSQGATQIYGHSIQANATPQKGAVLYFYIPGEMVYINSVKAKVRIDRFRSYSKSTAAKAEQVSTSSSGGSTTATSESGGGSGGSTVTSESGGHVSQQTVSSQQTTQGTGYYCETEYVDMGSASTSIYMNGNYVATSGHRHYNEGHSHRIPVIYHTHNVSIPAIQSHRHNVSVPGAPSHQHAVNIPPHEHTVPIPRHFHDIEQGIFEFGSPSGAQIYVNGMLKANMGVDSEIVLTTLLLDSNGNMPRGTWLNVEIRPNDLAYVCIDLFVQGFIQSRGESVY